MIYTKFKFYPSLINKTSLCILEENTKIRDYAVLLYDCHDLVIRKTDFADFIFESQWKEVKQNKTIKILIFFPDEYFNIIDIKRFATVIKEKGISEDQVFFLTMDENFKKFAIQEFKKLNLEINIESYNGLLKNVKEPDGLRIPTKKFSVLSRNYSVWRLNFYIKLLKGNLLNSFIYTFNNVHPYGDSPRVIPKKEVFEDLVSLNVEPTLDVARWIERLPFAVGNVADKHNDLTYTVIQKSNINVVIESHFDPFWTFYGEEEIYKPEEFSPAFPTEKTYKAIMCKRPFIIVSTPFFLKELKQLGYKTYSPFINESYDNIVDNNKRMDAIILEITRIKNLSPAEFEIFVKSCKDIAEYNYQQLLINQKQKISNEKFFWLNKYLVM